MAEIEGRLKELLMLAIFIVVLLAVGVALLPTVTTASYDMKVQADAANYTGHGVVGLIAYLIPLGYGLAVALGIFLVAIKAVKG
jgi:hypothetical protein